MPLYFENGPSPRRVLVLDRRDAVPQLGIRYTSVEQEMVSEETSVHELRNRVRAIHGAVKRLTKGLARADGERGGPASDRERAKWERQLLAERARIPQNEALLRHAERRLAMLHAVLAGKQFDDTLPPRKVPVKEEGEVAPELATPLPLDEADHEEDQPVAERGKSPAVDRVAEVAQHLSFLRIPTDLGRPKVRELLEQRDPGFRVGDALLSEAIKYRRPSEALVIG